MARSAPFQDPRIVLSTSAAATSSAMPGERTSMAKPMKRPTAANWRTGMPVGPARSMIRVMTMRPTRTMGANTLSAWAVEVR